MGLELLNIYKIIFSRITYFFTILTSFLSKHPKTLSYNNCVINVILVFTFIFFSGCLSLNKTTEIKNYEGYKSSLNPAVKTTLAVLYFDNNSIDDKERLSPLKKGIADMLITDLSKLHKLSVVERIKINAMLDEIEIGMVGMIDKNTIQRAGRFLGAKTLLLGSFVVIKKTMRIDARIVDVETGRVIKAEEVVGKTDNFFRLEKRLVSKIIHELDVSITANEKEKLRMPTNVSFEAVLYYSKGIDLKDKGRLVEAKKMFEKALSISPVYFDAQNQLIQFE